MSDKIQKGYKIVKNTCKDCNGSGVIQSQEPDHEHENEIWRNDKAKCIFYLCIICQYENHTYDCLCGAYGHERRRILTYKRFKKLEVNGGGYPSIVNLKSYYEKKK